MTIKQEVFETQDLNLSATLIVQGYKLENVHKGLDGKATFKFTSNPNLQLAIQKYWNNELLVNPQDLFNALKFLKNRIYSNY
jgi:hypothetical protein